jgi:uncharacterized protein (TIGR02679 family)
MRMPSDGRLDRLLGGEALSGLRKRLRRRFEHAKSDGDVESFRLGNLTTEEHAALASLLGRSTRFSNSLQVEVHLLDAALRQAGIAGSLQDALERLDGPIVHLATVRRQSEALWTGVLGGCRHDGLRDFLQPPAGIGLLKRLSGRNAKLAARLCSQAEAVLQRLPAKGITRAQLAASVLGDAHALDAGRAVATIVLAVWRQFGSPRAEAESASLDRQDDGNDHGDFRGERARDIWAKAGVLVNELARPAMFLNLPTGEFRDNAERRGEPTYASLRSLLRSTPRWAVARRNVFVCENANLVAIAADHLGSRCAPMVCTDGMPAAAQRTLLTQLARAGAHLYYHGDFDWPGINIGNHVVREYDARPWNFGAVEYVAALSSAPHPGYSLKGTPVVASWDKALAPTMQTHKMAIAEEGVAGILLQDLEE